MTCGNIKSLNPLNFLPPTGARLFGRMSGMDAEHLMDRGDRKKNENDDNRKELARSGGGKNFF